jgi:hypothetical protein
MATREMVVAMKIPASDGEWFFLVDPNKSPWIVRDWTVFISVCRQ